MNKTIINLKPSHRNVERFKAKFPEATFYGSTTLRGRGKSYLLPAEIVESKLQEIRQFGSIPKYQPHQS